MRKILLTVVMMTCAFNAVAQEAAAPVKEEKAALKEKKRGGWLSDLTKEQREQFKASMKKYSQKDEFKKLAEERKAIIAAETFDKAAFIANAKAFRQLMEKSRDSRLEGMAEALSTLSAADRRKIAERFGKPSGKMMKKGWKRHGGGHEGMMHGEGFARPMHDNDQEGMMHRMHDRDDD